MNIPVNYVDVVTMTLGIEILALETDSAQLLEMCRAKGRGKGTGAFVPEGLIENALHKRALCPELRQRLDQLEEMEKRLASKTARLVLIDCRGFCDPAAKGQGKGSAQGHLGSHIDNLVAMSQLRHHWTPLIEKCKTLSQTACDDKVQTLYMVFYCQKGRHRSVGAEFVIRHCLLHHSRVIDTVHVHKSLWYRSIRCGQCEECQGMTDAKAKLIKRTYDLIWNLENGRRVGSRGQ